MRSAGGPDIGGCGKKWKKPLSPNTRNARPRMLRAIVGARGERVEVDMGISPGRGQSSANFELILVSRSDAGRRVWVTRTNCCWNHNSPCGRFPASDAHVLAQPR